MSNLLGNDDDKNVFNITITDFDMVSLSRNVHDSVNILHYRYYIPLDGGFTLPRSERWTVSLTKCHILNKVIHISKDKLEYAFWLSNVQAPNWNNPMFVANSVFIINTVDTLCNVMLVELNKLPSRHGVRLSYDINSDQVTLVVPGRKILRLGKRLVVALGLLDIVPNRPERLPDGSIVYDFPPGTYKTYKGCTDVLYGLGKCESARILLDCAEESLVGAKNLSCVGFVNLLDNVDENYLTFENGFNSHAYTINKSNLSNIVIKIVDERGELLSVCATNSDLPIIILQLQFKKDNVLI